LPQTENPFVLSVSKRERPLSPTSSCLCLYLYLLCLLPACRPSTVDLKEDLTKYLDTARRWTATEAEINNAVSVVRQDQFVHDDLTTETLRPVVGVARDYVQQLERYQPQAPALVNVHSEYIEAWRAHYLAMAAVVDAVEKKDYIQLAKAKDDLLEAQRSIVGALTTLSQLLREAGLQRDAPPDQSPTSPEEGFEASP
jgi:hypothetical protein